MPLKKLAEHFGRGAAKYEDRNWERGYPWSLSYAAMQRHLNAFWGGQDYDPEFPDSHHLDAAMFHAMALRDFVEKFPEYDDRPKVDRSNWDINMTTAQREAIGEASRTQETDSGRISRLTPGEQAKRLRWVGPV